MTEIDPAYSGFCIRCATEHTLPMGTARAAALDLIQKLDTQQRLDFHRPLHKADGRCATGYLFGKERGKMFGVMPCRLPDGSIDILKAFSGQYNGQWEIDGWVPPVFDVDQWHRVNDDVEKEIKRLGKQIEVEEKTNLRRDRLINRRRQLSRDLMKDLHRIYILSNFRGERRPLTEAFIGGNHCTDTATGGLPNGTADCCGPKLLNFAACHRMVPLGLAEFFYGRETRQGDRVHGRFYPSCPDKCAPILGFMLCGLNTDTA